MRQQGWRRGARLILRFAAIVLLILCPTALAAHPYRGVSERMNLDRDQDREQVVAWDRVSFDHTWHKGDIVAIDRCAGREVSHELALPGRYLPVSAIQTARQLGRRGVLFTMNYDDGEEIARVARLRSRKAGSCPTPVFLFDYSTKSPPEPAPPGYIVSKVRLRAGEYSRRFPGRELLLIESYAESTSGSVRATRRTYLRFRTASVRYVTYRTIVRPT